MPSLRPITISVLVVLFLTGGLALAAHTTGQVLGRGTAGIAAGLISVAPPAQEHQRQPARESKPHSNDNPEKRQVDARKPEGHARAPRKRIVAADLASEARATGKRPDARPEPRSMDASQRVRSSRASNQRPWRERLVAPRSDAPTCDGVYVYIISDFENPSDSVATLSLDPKQRGRQRRVGQRLGPYQVMAIGYNPSRVSSAVWLLEGDRVCQALVRDVNPVREKLQRQRLKRAAKARAKKLARKKKRSKKSKRRRRK